MSVVSVLLTAVRSKARLCVLATVGLAVTGCGEGSQRIPVGGQVRLDGEPLTSGTILMTPVKAGPVAGCDIKDGLYEMPQERGPGPGEYRVEITAYRPTGKKVYDSDFNVSTETLVPIIPARYNTQSELTAVVSEEGSNEFNFDLQSK